MTLALLTSLLAWPASAHPDEVYLTNGGKLVGKATVDGDSVTVITPQGIKTTLKRDKVREIIYTKNQPDVPPKTGPTPPPEVKPSEPKPIEDPYAGIVQMEPDALRRLDFDETDFIPGVSDWFIVRGFRTDALIRGKDMTVQGGTNLACVRASRDGRTLFLAEKKGAPRRVSLDNLGGGRVYQSKGDVFECVLPSRDGSWVAGFARSTLVVWKADQPEAPVVFLKEAITPGRNLGWVKAFSADDSTFGGVDGSFMLRTWNARDGKVLAERDLGKEGLLSVDLSSDMSKLIALAKERVVVINPRTLATLKEGNLDLPAQTRWRISPRGKYMVAPCGAKGERGALKLLTLADLKEVAVWPRAEDSLNFIMTDMQFSADEKLVVVGLAAMGFAVLTVPELRLVHHQPDFNTYVNRVGFSGDARVIMTLESRADVGSASGGLRAYGHKP